MLRHERIWGFWQFTSVNVGLAIATWAFLTGGTIALFAGLKTALVATVIGNLVGASLVAVTTCLPSVKYGVGDQPWAESVVVRGRHIAYVGTETAAREHAGPEATRVDLAGGTSCPGSSTATRTC